MINILLVLILLFSIYHCFKTTIKVLMKIEFWSGLVQSILYWGIVYNTMKLLITIMSDVLDSYEPIFLIITLGFLIFSFAYYLLLAFTTHYELNLALSVVSNILSLGFFAFDTYSTIDMDFNNTQQDSFVDPNQATGHTRRDGNTNINSSKGEGGGYWR